MEESTQLAEPELAETIDVQHDDSVINFENEEDIYSMKPFADLQMITDILKQTVKYDFSKINHIEDQIDELDSKISYYRRFLFNEHDNDDSVSTIIPFSQQKKGIPRSHLSQNRAKKAEIILEETECIRFQDAQFPNLLNKAEPAQLLKTVSVKMKFKTSFLKYWMPIVRSEASCAILVDSFWYIMMTYFKKDPDYELDCYKFFCRISENFAALFFSIDTSFRDMFFDNYALFLCQAIYLQFYLTFTGSRLHLNEKFKNELCKITYEWVLGIRPLPQLHKKWVINDMIQSATADSDSNSNLSSEIMNKVNSLQKQLNSINEDEEKPLIGDFVPIETVSFDLRGKSVLIDHYTKMYSLDTATGIGNKMSRNELTIK